MGKAYTEGFADKLSERVLCHECDASDGEYITRDTVMHMHMAAARRVDELHASAECFQSTL